MKRKKWSELEEQTLLTKYSDLLNSGALSKLRTREKKFRPIAEHVNSVHNLQDPVTFPFKWSWRDITIKVQNMRHQYLGVKQKIRDLDGGFNWKDGDNHWENFLKYKEVFGDVELEVKEGSSSKKFGGGDKGIGFFGSLRHDDVLGIGFEIDSDDLEEDVELGDHMTSADSDLGVQKGEGVAIEQSGSVREKRLKQASDERRFGIVGAQVLELRNVLLRREDKRRERDWTGERDSLQRIETQREMELKKVKLRENRGEDLEARELESEERQMVWARQDFERLRRLERKFDEEKRRRMKLEEKWEEEEMEWKERMVNLQMEHEKQMMQLHADACQNQMQILGIISRLFFQFFGSVNDGLGGGLGSLPPQVLQNLQHTGGLGENVKPDANSPSQFL